MKFVLFVIFTFCFNFLKGQEFPCYRVYEMEEFVKVHFSDTVNFYRMYHMASHYPAIARENGLEGKMDVLMINHTDSSFEIFITNRKESIFKTDIYNTLLKTRKTWLHTDIPFILQFCVEYDMLYLHEKDSLASSPCGIKVAALPLSQWRDTSYVYNTREISYKPQLMDYPGFSNIKHPEHYHPYESIEDLLEMAVKSCCHKTIQLIHIQPIPPHSYGVYNEAKDYIRIFFHSKGYISKVELFGSKSDDIDINALTNTLKGIRFHPALSSGKPVHAAFEYKIE